ncbi:hypothetical protein ACN28I_22855 [Archangium gephyra]|uniref:hypothetical protein n=1 Tax=Archangium gephyra TaxID=48 RepID=UPI003B7DE79A
MHEDDLVALLREQRLGTERPVVRSGVERLWKTGRDAAGLTLSVVGGRLRGKGEGSAPPMCVPSLCSKIVRTPPGAVSYALV